MLAVECKVLVEKVVAKIQNRQAKRLSYAGKVQLVVSVVQGIQVFWAACLPVPKGVWTAIDQKLKKSYGGMLMQIRLPGDVQKLPVEDRTITVADMQDQSSSWKWPVGRRFKGVVQEFREEFQRLMEQCSGEDQVVWIHGANMCFKIKEVYNLLRGRGEKVKWCKLIWHKVEYPKAELHNMALDSREGCKGKWLKTRENWELALNGGFQWKF
ncbi:hypothetical protein LIER_20489 [Lithospermum erythrorhizon]|uniref:Uncharacterized protein n=1 Tax=Lithospermum erythrorhizon TaxID=34254 RepID=A0AAV3QLM3_LITER